MEKKAFYRMTAVFVTALTFCLGLRIFLKLKVINPESGFYDGGIAVVWVFNVILVGSLLFFLWNMLRQSIITWYHAFYANRFFNAMGVLMGFAYFLYCVQVVDDIITQREVHPFNAIGNYFLAGFCVLTGIAFFILGTSGLRSVAKDPPVLLMIVPVACQSLLLVIAFNHTTTLVTVSDNLLNLMFLALYCLFLLGHARSVCNVGSLKGRNYAVPMGLASALFGFVTAVPDVLYLLVTRQPLELGVFGKWGNILIIVMSLYAVSFVLALRRSVARQLG